MSLRTRLIGLAVVATLLLGFIYVPRIQTAPHVVEGARSGGPPPAPSMVVVTRDEPAPPP